MLDATDRIEVGISAYDCQPVMSSESGDPDVVVRNGPTEVLQLVSHKRIN
jgi:hypothetical protein